MYKKCIEKYIKKSILLFKMYRFFVENLYILSSNYIQTLFKKSLLFRSFKNYYYSSLLKNCYYLNSSKNYYYSYFLKKLLLFRLFKKLILFLTLKKQKNNSKERVKRTNKESNE
jgi:hypothetical protein